jgi:hypothetical protein
MPNRGHFNLPKSLRLGRAGHQLLAASERALRQMCWSQPLVDGRYQGGCLVADRELVVPRGHGTVPFEAIDAALYRVPSLVVLRVELRRTAAAGAGFLRLRAWSALSGMVQRMPRLRR